MQVILVTAAGAWLLRLLFGQEGFELLVSFTNIGFVLHEGRQGLLDQFIIQLFDVEQRQRTSPVFR